MIILTTEHNSVYAFDADNPGAGSLWERHYLDATSGVSPLPDNFGGRTTLGGEVGITGTPFIDSATGVMYFVTALSRNGVAEQWLRAIDVHTGNDFGPGSVQIQANVAGTAKGSVGGQIRFRSFYSKPAHRFNQGKQLNPGGLRIILRLGRLPRLADGVRSSHFDDAGCVQSNATGPAG